MTDDIDLQMGRRLRRRRLIMGLNQQQIADRAGVRFQQIQKYECAANKMSAERIWDLAQALEVPVGYFFDGLISGSRSDKLEVRNTSFADDILIQKETMDLVSAYYRLDDKPRRHLLELTKAMDVNAQA